MLRLCCIPAFLVLLFGRHNRAAAAWMLGALGMTDWVDGYIARRFNQVTELGKVLDPVADRLALIVGVVAILIDGSAPLWVGILALVREVAVSVAVLILAGLGAKRVDVTWWGKTGTFLLYFAFPFWLGGRSTLSYAPFLDHAAWFVGIGGLLAAYYSAAAYVPLGAAALREGRLSSAR